MAVSVTKEKVNNPFLGTIYESGYGYSFSYVMNHPDYDLDMKYVFSVYGLYFNSDGSGSCTVHRNKLINDIAHMKTKDFVSARNRLQKAGVIVINERRQKYTGSSDRQSQDTNEITLNLVPNGFKENTRSGVKYGNILSYPYGQLPRCIFNDTSLEKSDKVIASYIFANVGKIREYLLSGVKLRCSLKSQGSNGALTEMSMYKFEKALQRLKPYIDAKRLSDKEVIEWRMTKHQERVDENTHGDYYIITIKNGMYSSDKPYSSKMNNYSFNINPLDSSNKNLGTPEESLIVDNSNLGTSEEGTPEEGTSEQGTAEEGTPINNPLSDNHYTQNYYCHKNSLYHHNLSPTMQAGDKNGTDDSKTLHDADIEFYEKPKRCPEELLERLGYVEALNEISGLNKILNSISDEKATELRERLNDIADSLYEIVLTSPDLEEYALAYNVSLLISHRLIKREVRNVGGYVRRIIENADIDEGFVSAPVEEISGYRAYLDGFKLSDRGASKRKLIDESQKEPVRRENINELIDLLKSTIEYCGYEKGEKLITKDTPLPSELTQTKDGRRCLAVILCSFFREEAYQKLKKMYYGSYANGVSYVDDVILTLQEAIMRLYNPKDEFYTGDDAYFDKNFGSKKLMSLFYLDGTKELRIRLNIFEKVVALYLKAQSEQGIYNKTKWIKTAFVNELKYCDDVIGDTGGIINVENPVPAFMSVIRRRNHEILNTKSVSSPVEFIPLNRTANQRDEGVEYCFPNFDMIAELRKRGGPKANNAIDRIMNA